MLNKIEEEGNIQGVRVKAGLITHCDEPGWYVIDGDLMLDSEPAYLAPVTATEDEAAEVFARMCAGEWVDGVNWSSPDRDFTIALVTNSDEPGWYAWDEGAINEGPWLLAPADCTEKQAKDLYESRMH